MLHETAIKVMDQTFKARYIKVSLLAQRCHLVDERHHYTDRIHIITRILRLLPG